MVNISDHFIGLGALMREKRERKDLSQTQVGEFVGVTKSMVSKWERGEYLQNTGITKIAKICSLLNIDPLLFTYDPDDVTTEGYIEALRALMAARNINLEKSDDDDYLLDIIMKSLNTNAKKSS